MNNILPNLDGLLITQDEDAPKNYRVSYDGEEKPFLELPGWIPKEHIDELVRIVVGEISAKSALQYNTGVRLGRRQQRDAISAAFAVVFQPIVSAIERATDTTGD